MDPEIASLDWIVKEPLVRGALALYPLFAAAPPAPPYLTGPEASRMGLIRVAEKPGGATVPELVVHNTGALPLLLLEGETIVGAKQNRTLDVSVLVPAGTAIAVPVSCVEAGRWGAARPTARSPRHAPSDLRRVKATSLAAPGRRGDKQHAVWDRVARYQADLAAPSPTGALEDAFAAREPELAHLLDGAALRPDQRGVLVAIGGTPCALDWFDKPETLAAYWDALVPGYALDALGVPAGPAPSTSEVEAALAAVVAAPRTPVPSAGLGTVSTFAGAGVVGLQLCWSGAAVHIGAFLGQDGQVGQHDPVRTTTGPVRRRRTGPR